MKSIYIRTNLINGKQYVGQTGNFKERERAWNKKNNIYGNAFLSKERYKYGLENWNVEIVKECKDFDADYWEQYFINEKNTVYPNGYNVQTGGKKGFTYNETDNTRKKKSESHKGIAPKCVEEKTVYQYTLDGELIGVYKSEREAERQTKTPHTNITRCCNGGFFNKERNKWVNVKKANGYKWSYTPL